MSATIERAKENNPSELKKQLAEAKREIEKLRKSSIPAPVDERDISRRIKTAVDDETRNLKQQLAQRDERIATMVASAKEELLHIVKELGVKFSPGPAPRKNIPPSRVIPPDHPARIAARQEITRVARPIASNGTVSAPQQRILNALAWLESVRLPSPQKNIVAWLADQSPTSSGYANNLGSLRSSGLIEYPQPGVVALTDQGRSHADAGNAPLTVDEVQRAVLAKLSTPQQKILNVLIALYPDAIEKERVAEMAEASVTSSGFANNLGAMRSLGIIDYPSPGKVVAKPVMFLEE
jgi:hypothetical protein